MTTGPIAVTYSYSSCRDCIHTACITTREGVRMRVCEMPNFLIPPIKDGDGKEWFYVALTDMEPNDKTPFWCKYLSDGELT